MWREFVEGETLEGRLRLGWQWDPLRNDPRFQEILATPEPQTIFLEQLIKREQFASETFPF